MINTAMAAVDTADAVVSSTHRDRHSVASDGDDYYDDDDVFAADGSSSSSSSTVSTSTTEHEDGQHQYKHTGGAAKDVLGDMFATPSHVDSDYSDEEESGGDVDAFEEFDTMSASTPPAAPPSQSSSPHQIQQRRQRRQQRHLQSSLPPPPVRSELMRMRTDESAAKETLSIDEVDATMLAAQQPQHHRRSQLKNLRNMCAECDCDAGVHDQNESAVIVFNCEHTFHKHCFYVAAGYARGTECPVCYRPKRYDHLVDGHNIQSSLRGAAGAMLMDNYIANLVGATYLAKHRAGGGGGGGGDGRRFWRRLLSAGGATENMDTDNWYDVDAADDFEIEKRAYRTSNMRGVWRQRVMTMVTRNATPLQLKNAFDVNELLNSGITVDTFVAHGYFLEDLYEMGVTEWNDLLAMGAGARHLFHSSHGSGDDVIPFPVNVLKRCYKHNYETIVVFIAMDVAGHAQPTDRHFRIAVHKFCGVGFTAEELRALGLDDIAKLYAFGGQNERNPDDSAVSPQAFIDLCNGAVADIIVSRDGTVLKSLRELLRFNAKTLFKIGIRREHLSRLGWRPEEVETQLGISFLEELQNVEDRRQKMQTRRRVKESRRIAPRRSNRQQQQQQRPFAQHRRRHHSEQRQQRSRVQHPHSDTGGGDDGRGNRSDSSLRRPIGGVTVSAAGMSGARSEGGGGGDGVYYSSASGSEGNPRRRNARQLDPIEVDTPGGDGGIATNRRASPYAETFRDARSNSISSASDGDDSDVGGGGEHGAGGSPVTHTTVHSHDRRDSNSEIDDDDDDHHSSDDDDNHTPSFSHGVRGSRLAPIFSSARQRVRGDRATASFSSGGGGGGKDMLADMSATRNVTNVVESHNPNAITESTAMESGGDALIQVDSDGDATAANQSQAASKNIPPSYSIL